MSSMLYARLQAEVDAEIDEARFRMREAASKKEVSDGLLEPALDATPAGG